METDPAVRPFRVDVPEEDLDDLRRRIAATRWPSKELVEDRSQGVQLATLRELARFWTTEYDWRTCEARLNALPQFTTEIDGVDIHFIHVRSQHENALPLIMTHGWPGSVIELLETVGPLTDPTVPVGFTTFPGEIWTAPRSWVETVYPNLTYFNEVDSGGHFAAWEEPELFATEVREAFRSLRIEALGDEDVSCG
jgi:pimeloyl-ACP methyl ester carboxylesterase